MSENVVIIGAGPCGLAIARQLRHQHGIDPLVIDAAAEPASSWRTRYDGFRLNTCGWWSHLPGQRIPLKHGRWPTREAMVDYFDSYVRTQQIRIDLGVEIERIDQVGDGWRAVAADREYHADSVIVATGNYRRPWTPSWPGIDRFTGAVVHSLDYRNAWPFIGQDVAVVGCGNSAADIAVQLCDGGAARVRMALRTPPHLVRRSTIGVPPDALAILASHARVPTVDRVAALLRSITFGDLSAYGFATPPQGIYRTVLDTGRIPTLAEELIYRVRTGRIEIVSAVQGFDADEILLDDGQRIAADTVIAATGFRQGLEQLVGHLGVLDDNGHPKTNGVRAALPGLWFAGFAEPFTGPLRSFRRQAAPIATAVASQRSTSYADVS